MKCRHEEWGSRNDVSPQKRTEVETVTDTITCPYCSGYSQLVNGTVIYPHRPDLAKLKFWLCRPCWAYTGTHINSKRHAPKGRLANAELRAAKIAAHAAFDPKWRNGGMSRKEAYKWLQTVMQREEQPHIGWMDVNECKEVVALCSSQKGEVKDVI
jgi:hypothetical protein